MALRPQLNPQAARAADLEAKRLAAEARAAEEARRAEEARKVAEEEASRKEVRAVMLQYPSCALPIIEACGPPAASAAS